MTFRSIPFRDSSAQFVIDRACDSGASLLGDLAASTSTGSMTLIKINFSIMHLDNDSVTSS